jgi:hypothetical protein
MSSITEAPNMQRFNNLQDRDRILGTSGMGNVPEEMDSSAIPNCEGKRPVFNEIDEYEVQSRGTEDPRHFMRVRKWTVVVIISLTSASV